MAAFHTFLTLDLPVGFEESDPEKESASDGVKVSNSAPVIFKLLKGLWGKAPCLQVLGFRGLRFGDQG